MEKSDDAGTGIQASSSSSKRSRRINSTEDAETGSHEDGVRIKRQRVSRACDQCRLGREKCNGVKPTCQTCTAGGRSCTYATNPRKRGIQPGYIRALELSLAWLFAQDIGAEQSLKQQLALSDSEIQQVISGRSANAADTWHSQWSSSIVCKQIDRLLSGADPQDAAVTEPNRPEDTCRRAAPSVDPVRADTRSALDQASVAPELGLGQPSGQILLAPAGSTQSARLTLPSDFWKLLDTYYVHTHCWFPASDKNEVLKAAYAYPAEGIVVSPGTPGSGIHAELWAILALTLHQTTESSIAGLPQDVLNTACRLVPAAHDSFELGHVKALLLLGMIHMALRRWTAAWMLVGSAIRIASYLDLHLLVSSAAATSRCRHVLLCCFMLDNIMCRYLHKQPLLQAEFVSSIGLLDEDGLEEWSPWEGRSGGNSRQPARSLSSFNATIRLLIGQDSVGSHSWTLGTTQTPAQLHLKLLKAWLDHQTGTASEDVLRQTIGQIFDPALGTAGVASVPPTLVPLIERLISRGVFSSHTPLLVGEIHQAWLPESTSRSHSGRPVETARQLSTDPYRMAQTPPLAPIHASSKSPVGVRRATRTLASPPVTQTYSAAFDTGNSLQTLSTFANGHMQSVPLASHNQTQAYDFQTQMPHKLSNTVFSGKQPLQSEQLTPDFHSDADPHGADLEAIFEEIALLEGNSNTTDGTQFMQNLGIGPDLDLSLFFGSDYQQSDPMLAYLQPDMMLPNVEGQNGTFPGG